MMVKELKYANSILIFLGVFALLTPIFIKLPNESGKYRFLRIPECVIKAQTGKVCTTCGLTRSIVYLYRGDWPKSEAYHPYGHIFFIWAALQFMIRPLVIFRPTYRLLIIDMAQLILFLVIFTTFCK